MKSGVGRFTVTVTVTVLLSESTTVIVALPAPPAVAVKVGVSVGTVMGFEARETIPLSLVYTVNGPNPPIMVNVMIVPVSTAMVLGLIARDDEKGVTVITAVSVVPTLSITVKVTGVEAATGFGVTVKVLPATAAFGTTAVLFENAVPP